MSTTKEDSTVSGGLFKVLALQEANGGFVIDKAFAQELTMSVKEINEISRKIQSTGNPENYTLLSTALVLTYIKNVYMDRIRIWESVVKKSEKWFAEQISMYSPKLESHELLEWAELFLKGKGMI